MFRSVRDRRLSGGHCPGLQFPQCRAEPAAVPGGGIDTETVPHAFADVEFQLRVRFGRIVSGYSCGQGNFRLGGRLTCGLVVAGGCGEIYPPVNRMVQAVLPPDTVPFESADAKGGHCVCRVLEVLEDVD